ncbi:MAG TPA: TonB-dependent receptor, partial [Acidobacteriota bacterium]|nr:TonB-dependent receptor [Acidobacteriota bacterium]
MCKINRIRLAKLALLAAVVGLLTFGGVKPVEAQVLYGVITGQVQDPSGAAVPGADVTAVNVATNLTLTAVTNDVGNYTIRNVPVGTYRLRVSLPGFKEYVAENIIVTAGQVTRHNARLQVGELTETITVSGAATLLKTDTAEVSTQLETVEIEALPLNIYRNYQALLNLVPGATPVAFQNAITDTPGRALTTNINGTARNMNNTRIDGAMSVNIWLPHHTAYVPPSETIEVVDVSTNNFDAEKGFAGGASVTVITKSGTNELHGSAWYYHENSALNARKFFNYNDLDGDGEADNPPGRRHIWGGTIGGPIIKDKLFYFGGFEATQEGTAQFSTATLPTADQRAGDFSAYLPISAGGTCDPTKSTCTIIYDPLTGDANGYGKVPFPGNIIPSDRLSPIALKMQELLPLPNQPGLVSNYGKGGQRIMNRYNTDVKVDWYRTENHRIWGKFSWLDATVEGQPLFGPGGGGAVGGGGDGVGDTDVKVYSVGHSWTITPTFLLDGNFGFTDMDQFVDNASLALGNYGLETLGIPGVNAVPGQERACIVDGQNLCGGLPYFAVGGYSAFGQLDGWTPVARDENSFTLTNNFSLSKGNHDIRFGYDLVKHMLNHWQPEQGYGPRGGFSFSQNTTALPGQVVRMQNGWASYLLGYPSYMAKALQWELMTANEWQHAWYVRDRWQVTPKLTLTAGLRYEFYPLVERDDRPMEYLDLHSIVPCATGECFEVVLDNDTNVSKSLFAPRVGLAYRLTDNDVFRAGYGITYSPLPFARPLRGFYPLVVSGTWEAQTAFAPFRTLAEGIPFFVGPETAPGARVPLPPYAEMRSMPAEEITRGYIQSWNVTYERKLPAEFVVSLGYVGTSTVHQMARHDINWSPPGGGDTGRQLYPHSTTGIYYFNGWLSANYHSLQIAINRRFVDGLFVKGAYTWGRAINMADDEGWQGVSWNDPALIYRNRAQAGYNRPHILQLATIYEIPWGKEGDSLAAKILGNWQLNGIFSVNNNAPFTVGTSSPINTRANSQTADQVKDEVEKLGGIGRGNPYYDPTAFAPVTRVPGVHCNPADTSCYGNSGRNILRGPTWVNLDLS